MAACGPKPPQVAPGNPVQESMWAPWYVSNLQLYSDLGVPYLAEHIRSIAQSLYSTFPDAENPLVRQLGRYLAYSRDVWEHVKSCTKIQNSILAFIPDGVSLIVEASAETIPTSGLTIQKSKIQIAIRITAPFVLFRSGSSVVVRWMPEQLPRKGHGPTLQRKTLATQGCGLAVKFCLRPALNPRVGYENNCLLSSDASRTQEWKQHGGRRHSCFALEWDSASGSLLWSWSCLPFT